MTIPPVPRGDVIRGNYLAMRNALVDDEVDELAARAALQIAADYYLHKGKSISAALERMQRDVTSEVHSLLLDVYQRTGK